MGRGPAISLALSVVPVRNRAWRLDEIMAKLRGRDRQVAWHAARVAVLARVGAIACRFGLAVHLGAQLPLLVRGSLLRPVAPEARQNAQATLGGTVPGPRVAAEPDSVA